MAIARYENITVNNLTFGISAFGEQSTAQKRWFDTRAVVSSVSNSVRISEKYRAYADLTNFRLNYTPNTRKIVDNQSKYSIGWRGQEWRIDSVREADDRMSVTLLCYHLDPATAV